MSVGLAASGGGGGGSADRFGDGNDGGAAVVVAVLYACAYVQATCADMHASFFAQAHPICSWGEDVLLIRCGYNMCLQECTCRHTCIVRLDPTLIWSSDNP